jgi:HlyD family secretion protein
MNAKRVVPVAVVVVAAAVVVWLFVAGRNGSTDALEASGSVEAMEADLGFQTGGRIASILVNEGDVVQQGSELARLDVAELDARRAGAEAQLDAARALLAELRQGARPEELRQARSMELAARERMQDAARALERTRTLEEGGAVSREALDQARTAHEVARAQHAQTVEAVQIAQRGARAERIDAQTAAVRQAQAALGQAQAQLAHALVTAPFDGVVTVRHRQPGEAVGPGAPVVTIMNPGDRWVRIYVREDAIGRVSVGQRAEIRSDSDRDRTFDGRVTFIATQAEFTPRNVQTTEERVKLVYAVRVAIEGDAGMMLKPGVPADVRLLPDS